MGHSCAKVWATRPQDGEERALQKADEVRMVVTHPDDVRTRARDGWINPDVQEVYLQRWGPGRV